MSFTYKLPKIGADNGAAIVTPVAGDTALAQGELTLKDEAGNAALTVKISDITGWGYAAYAAGTAHVVDVDYTAATLIGDNLYSLVVDAPYVVHFFGGGQETNAVYATRQYTVSTDATPTATELAAAFEAAILADTNACFTASAAVGVLTITASSASAGELSVSTTAPGATVADSVAWVSPVGTTEEAEAELGVNLSGAGYNRYIIEYNKFIRHAAVKGLKAAKSEKFVYYIDKDNAGTAAAVTLLTSILNGSYATVAGYLGAPNF